MDITFVEESGKFIVVYLDDVTVFSQSDDDTCGTLDEFSRNVEGSGFI
jgi:hypothetical protein